MKVLHVIPSISLNLGGPSQVVINEVKYLRQWGVDAEIVTTNDDEENTLDVPLNQRIIYQDVPVYFLPRFNPRLKEFIFSPAITNWLWQNMQHYDLINTHYLFSFSPSCAAAIARFKHIPYIMRTIGQLTPWALEQSKLKKQIYSLLIEKNNLNHAAKIHCTAPAEAEDVKSFGIKTPTFVLPLGVNPPDKLSKAEQKIRSQYNILEHQKVILFLSRLHYKKRPDFLIDALVNLKKERDDFYLILAGSGEPDYLEYLQDKISSGNLENNVTFAGFVAGETKDLLLQGADLFVLPSFSENFGLAIAEAMAAKCPVIVTKGIQIAPQIADYEAGLMIENDQKSLIEALKNLLDSSTLRQQLGSNGLKLVQEQYSWKAIAGELAKIYQSIIDEKIKG